MTEDADLVVIGTGGAAMAAAIEARQAGAGVVLVERDVLGGTCVNVGCVPSKTLLAAAGRRHAALHNPFGGAPTTAGDVHASALISQKDALVAGMRQAKYADVAAGYGFEVRPGQATFTGDGVLAVDGRPLRARAYVVATGSTPAVPDLPGLEGVEWLTSTTAMELTELPASLVVVGAGHVGLEQAQLFAHLGVPVTLVGRPAPWAEPELVERLCGVLRSDGIDVVAERAASVAPQDGAVGVTTRSGRVVSGQRLLVATGRAPRTDGLGLAAAGVTTDERGFVVVDEHQGTSNPRVWAAGDVTGAPQYVYVAAATGRAAARNALAGDPSRRTTVDYTGLPSVLFTRPQLASAGLTEAEALAAGHATETRLLDHADVPRALVEHDSRGAVKVVAEAGTGRILGVHALAPAAGELMLAATYAIRAGMTVDDVAGTWAPYLTMAESLRIAAGLFRSELPTSCCA